MNNEKTYSIEKDLDEIISKGNPVKEEEQKKDDVSEKENTGSTFTFNNNLENATDTKIYQGKNYINKKSNEKK